MTDKEIIKEIEKADELTTLKIIATTLIVIAQNSTYIMYILGIIVLCQITQCK